MNLLPVDPFVRDVLRLREFYRGSLTTPTIPDSIAMPYSIETREPDLNTFAKIQSCDPLTLSVQVDHPEVFQVGDFVLAVQARSHEILVSGAAILEIVDRTIYLEGTEPSPLSLLRPDDLLVKQSPRPSVLMTFIQSKVEPYDRQEIREIRDNLREDPIEPPNPLIVRTPGKKPFGIRSHHLPLPGSHIPEGSTVLPIEFSEELDTLSNRSGWLLHTLLSEDTAFLGRWRHWQTVEAAGQLLPQHRIPYINFEAQPDHGTVQRCLMCLDLIDRNWDKSRDLARTTLTTFFDWLLWSLGHPSVAEFPPALRETRAHDLMLQVFGQTAGRFLLYPTDYFGELLKIVDYPGIQSIHEATRLTKSIFLGRRNDYRDAYLLDPDCRSGALLLASSNHTYQYQGITSDLLYAKATLLNSYFYVPWHLFPFSFLPAPNPIDTIANTLPVMRSRSTPANYFSTIQLDPAYHQYLPIILVQPRQSSILTDLLHSTSLPPGPNLNALTPEPETLPTTPLPPCLSPEPLPPCPSPQALPNPGDVLRLPPSRKSQ